MQHTAKRKPNRRLRKWWRGLLLVAVLPWSAHAEGDLPEAWLDAAQMFVRDAHSVFAEALKSGPANAHREAELGAAVTLLELPPQTQGRINEGMAALRRLYQENGNDTIGQAACYLVGRIRQVYYPEDQAEALPSELVSLAKEHPESVFGQMAMLKLTMHRLYLPVAEPTVADRFRTVAAYEAKITNPGLLREYHLIVANAQIFFETDQPEALRHLRAALQLGIPSALMRADVLVQVGELARAQGQAQVAEASYRQFIDENNYDARIQMVRDRLAELEAVRTHDE